MNKQSQNEFNALLIKARDLIKYMQQDRTQMIETIAVGLRAIYDTKKVSNKQQMLEILGQNLDHYLDNKVKFQTLVREMEVLEELNNVIFEEDDEIEDAIINILSDDNTELKF